MTEARLQHELIMFYGQEWPEYQKLLFEVNNNPKNEAHGAYRKAMGMKKDVSDLVLCVPHIGIFAGIECKAPASKWPTSKILDQLNWGKQIIEHKGFYIMSSNLNQVREFIIYLMNTDLKRATEIQSIALFYVEKQLKNKTIKF